MEYAFDNYWDTYFGQTLFETINLPRYAQVGALPSYNGSDIEAISIEVPNKSEQEHIGSFLNNLITLSPFISVSLKTPRTKKRVSTKDVLLILNLIKFRIL